MKQGADKENRIYILIMMGVALFSILFVMTMGFLNYRTTAMSLQEQLISRTEKETVSGMETAISFGKSFENYYGMNEVFEAYSRQTEKNLPFVIDRAGKLLYSGENDSGLNQGNIQELLSSREFHRSVDNLLTNGGGVVTAGSLHCVLVSIQEDGETIGYFGSLFTSESFYSGLYSLLKKMVPITLIIIAGVWIAFFIYGRIFEWRNISRNRSLERARKTRRVICVMILTVGIIILSGLSLYQYQQDYKLKIHSSVETTLQQLEKKIANVRDQGVDLRNVNGLKDYIRKRVENVQILKSVRLTEYISEVTLTQENSDLIRYAFGSLSDSDTVMFVEAEISDAAVNREMSKIVMVLLSTMIILMIFAFELNPMAELLTGRILAGDKGSFSEKSTSLALRFTGFILATAEYMCVPYAAMMIRDSGESLFGLSNGMTAALPLTLEGVMQMLGMFVWPKIVKKADIRVVLVLSGILMAGCNAACFISGSVLIVVVCRALAGFAYAGFKQVSNFLITKGYETDAGRSENISQDNAGLLAGATCGAGLGAILSANVGYGMTFMISACFFIIYLIVCFTMIPWRILKAKEEEKVEEGKVSAGKVFRMIFSPEILYFILFIGIPLNIGVMLCVTLIPAVCQTQGISSVMLSYCYIANGIAGIYVGPALVSRAKKRFGLAPCIAFAFALTAVGIFILHVPPIIVMIVLTSMILGFLDGFATPMVTDSFMSLKVVKNSVDESTALMFSVVLTYVLLTVAPMIAELMILPGKGFMTPMMIGAAVYAVAAFVLLVSGGRLFQKDQTDTQA